MDKSIKSLKVVFCNYYPMTVRDVESSKVKGIFVVLYSEEDDPNCVVPQNVVALKVTTSRPYSSMYVKVDDTTELISVSESDTFTFRKESYILGNHILTLPIANCVVLGELNTKDSAKVISMVSDLFGKIINQTCTSVINRFI